MRTRMNVCICIVADGWHSNRWLNLQGFCVRAARAQQDVAHRPTVTDGTDWNVLGHISKTGTADLSVRRRGAQGDRVRLWAYGERSARVRSFKDTTQKRFADQNQNTLNDGAANIKQCFCMAALCFNAIAAFRFASLMFSVRFSVGLHFGMPRAKYNFIN